MDIIKVSAHSRVACIAGTITAFIQEYHRVELQATGPKAVHQMVKGLILATRCLKCNNISVTSTPEFVDINFRSRKNSAIKFVVQQC